MSNPITESQILSLLNILISASIELEDELGNDHDLSNTLRYFADILKEYLK